MRVMSYEQALEKAWADLAGLTEDNRILVKFISDEYEILIGEKRVMSLSCNITPKYHINLILLHYLVRKLKVKAPLKPTGKWIDFRELEGGQGYYPAFKQRTMGVILRKYGDKPEALTVAAKRLNGEAVKIGDVSVIVKAFEDLPVLITLSKADEEFGPDANILFDETIRDILCTEDIVVLTEIIAHLI